MLYDIKETEIWAKEGVKSITLECGDMVILDGKIHYIVDTIEYGHDKSKRVIINGCGVYNAINQTLPVKEVKSTFEELLGKNINVIEFVDKNDIHMVIEKVRVFCGKECS